MTMMRTRICLFVLLAGGCYGDMVSTRAGGTGGEGEPTGPDAAGIDPGLELTCADPATATEDGYHYPGMACLGCHNGSLGPAFTVGGTLFADAAGAAPVSGVTVHLLGADGGETRMLAAMNGNFWTADPVVFPATAYVSSCPDVTPMPIETELGDCNGCHGPGSHIAFAAAP